MKPVATHGPNDRGLSYQTFRSWECFRAGEGNDFDGYRFRADLRSLRVGLCPKPSHAHGRGALFLPGPESSI
jgi:hypothetical protein